MVNVPIIDMAATGKRIAALRDAAGLTVRDLQDILGFANPQAIYKWQHGTALPTLDNLVILANAFDVAMDDMFMLVHEGKKVDWLNSRLNEKAGFLCYTFYIRNREEW